MTRGAAGEVVGFVPKIDERRFGSGRARPGMPIRFGWRTTAPLSEDDRDDEVAVVKELLRPAAVERRQNSDNKRVGPDITAISLCVAAQTGDGR